MKYKIHPLEKYLEWFQGQTPRSKLQIIKRLDVIKIEGHFGHHKALGEGLSELKFNDGRRIYYTINEKTKVILILGGNKNGQDSDIRKAKNALKSVKESAQKRS